ncbi:MAG: GNAT family N-acetyltransferase [Terricaulis sp.]
MLNFRTAAATDIPAALALIEKAFRGESASRGWTHEADLLGGQRTDAQALTAIIENPDERLILAERGGALCGCVMLANKGMREDRRIGYLGLLAVDPDLQAGGIGGVLVNEAERLAREFGAEIMEITVIKRRVELIAWYLRRDYALTGREEPFPLDDPRFGLPKTRDLSFVVMAKPLTPAH